MAAGDEAALAALFDETSGVLFALAMRVTGDRRDAEEALLDAYAKAWRTAATFDPTRSPARAWLVMMTRSAALDRKRRARPREEQLGVAEAAIASSEPAADERLVDWERGARARRALQALPPEQREALELAFFEGLTHAELAAKLRLPLGTVKTRIRLGMQHLRAILDEEGAERP
jgi:RNA polymerase sigma-70 factor (ECF subfamily)